MLQLNISIVSSAHTMKLLKPCIILLVFVLAIEALEKARYDNYRVYKFAIENDQQQKLIKEIEKYPDGVRSSECF